MKFSKRTEMPSRYIVRGHDDQKNRLFTYVANNQLHRDCKTEYNINYQTLS